MHANKTRLYRRTAGQTAHAKRIAKRTWREPAIDQRAQWRLAKQRQRQQGKAYGGSWWVECDPAEFYALASEKHRARLAQESRHRYGQLE